MYIYICVCIYMYIHIPYIYTKQGVHPAERVASKERPCEGTCMSVDSPKSATLIRYH